MFRDLARMTASLKGPRYEGALIAKAVWECGHDAGAGMRILRDHHACWKSWPLMIRDG